MYWNRFDICAAYYVYAMYWHDGQWSDEYAIFGRLDRIRYEPCRHIADGKLLKGEDDNARDIYAALVRKARKAMRRS